MPGVKSVNWTVQNKAKALDALLNFATVKIGDQVAGLIAQHVGSGCKPAAIHSLLANTRRRFVPENGVGAASNKVRQNAQVTDNVGGNRVVTGRVKKPSQKRADVPGKPLTPPKTPSKKRKRIIDSESDDAMSTDRGASPVGTPVKDEPTDADEALSLPSPSPAKRRSTPRSVGKVNYQVMENGNVNDSTDNDKEDEEPSDEEYKGIIEDEEADDYWGNHPEEEVY